MLKKFKKYETVMESAGDALELKPGERVTPNVQIETPMGMIQPGIPATVLGENRDNDEIVIEFDSPVGAYSMVGGHSGRAGCVVSVDRSKLGWYDTKKGKKSTDGEGEIVELTKDVETRRQGVEVGKGTKCKILGPDPGNKNKVVVDFGEVSVPGMSKIGKYEGSNINSLLSVPRDSVGLSSIEDAPKEDFGSKFKKGDRVKVNTGVFKGDTGIVIGYERNHGTVVGAWETYVLKMEDTGFERKFSPTILDSAKKVRRHYEPGDRIKITKGMYKDEIGEVLDFDPQKERVRVSISKNRTLTKLWVDFDEFKLYRRKAKEDVEFEKDDKVIVTGGDQKGKMGKVVRTSDRQCFVYFAHSKTSIWVDKEDLKKLKDTDVQDDGQLAIVYDDIKKTQSTDTDDNDNDEDDEYVDVDDDDDDDFEEEEEDDDLDLKDDKLHKKQVLIFLKPKEGGQKGEKIREILVNGEWIKNRVDGTVGVVTDVIRNKEDDSVMYEVKYYLGKQKSYGPSYFYKEELKEIERNNKGSMRNRLDIISMRTKLKGDQLRKFYKILGDMKIYLYPSWLKNIEVISALSTDDWTELKRRMNLLVEKPEMSFEEIKKKPTTTYYSGYAAGNYRRDYEYGDYYNNRYAGQEWDSKQGKWVDKATTSTVTKKKEEDDKSNVVQKRKNSMSLDDWRKKFLDE